MIACAKTTLRSSKAIGFVLFLFVLSPIGVSSQIVKWKVVDGGWCDLVYVPIPPASHIPRLSSSPIEPPPSSTINLVQNNNSILINNQTVNQTNLSVIAQNTKSSNASDDNEEGFESLFNGENLDGWIIQGLEKAGPKIENGVMKMTGWDYWAAITKEEFKNFILRFEVMFDPKGNSGVLIHTPKNEVFKSSFEIQMADDEGKPDSKKWPGAIVGFTPPLKNAFKPIGEWNTVEIKYIEPQIWVTVNGEIVQDGVDSAQIAGLLHKLNRGSIALQRNDLKKAAYYRNLRVKRLPE